MDVFNPAEGSDFTECYHELVNAKNEVTAIVKGVKAFKIKETEAKV